MAISHFSILVVMVLTYVRVSQCAPVSQQSCDPTVDLVFLVDTSTSVYKWDFNSHVKSFINDVVEAFNVGPGPRDTRIGLALFSNRVHHWFYLKAYTTKEGIKRNVKNMEYRSGNTYTHKGLEFTAYPLLSRQYGARPDVPKAVIIVTDGKSVYVNRTLREAQKLKDKGVYLFTIGVGAWNDYKELRGIASKPATQFYFNITDKNVVENIKMKFTDCFASSEPSIKKTSPDFKTKPFSSSLLRTTAQKTTMSTSTVPITHSTNSIGDDSMPTTSGSVPSCQGKPAHIYFLIDTSSSTYFQQPIVKFVENFTTSISNSGVKTEVSLYTFSSEAHDGLTSLLTTGEQTLKDAVEMVDGSNAGDAISNIIRRAFDSGAAGKAVPQIIVTITDGTWNRPQTTRWTEDTRRRGIYLFAISVSHQVDLRELQSISSKPAEQFTFAVENVHSLGSIAETLNQKTCDVVAGLWSGTKVPVQTVTDLHIGTTEISFLIDEV